MPEHNFLSDENHALLAKHERFRQELFERPSELYPLISKCVIRVLLVADDFLYFNDENFGLSDFVDILQVSFSPYVTLNVRKAHRDNPGAIRLNGADANFTFSDASLTDVDVLFLFAAHDRTGPKLAPAEREAIERFMEVGGVFATGDHEDLGVAMCGEIPRVRSMRKWYWPQSEADTAGQPVAPDGGTASRHDTNREGHDPGFEFDDQSDDVPQRIVLRTYSTDPVILRGLRPHPLLCGPSGRKIDILPDHPHEGECIAEFNDIDFPMSGRGHRERPEVIAWSRMIPGAETAGKPPVPGGTFGAISAYDGHRSEAGRIATDATWHHFININLTGTTRRPVGHPKRLGFLATPEGEAHFERIKAYFRNLAVWLAPRSIQTCIAFRKALGELVLPSNLFEELHSIKLTEATRSQLLQIGRSTMSSLTGNTEICEEILIYELLPRFLERVREDIRPRPWPQPDPPPFQLTGEIAIAALGGMMIRLRDELATLDVEDYSEALEQHLMARAASGAAIAVKRVLDAAQADLQRVQGELQALEEAVRHVQ